MQAEAKALSISFGGTETDLAARIRAHHESFTHSRKPSGARPHFATGFYATPILRMLANQRKQAEARNRKNRRNRRKS